MPLPVEPGQCRRNAETGIADGDARTATCWALLAIAGHLAEISRQLKRRT